MNVKTAFSQLFVQDTGSAWKYNLYIILQDQHRPPSYQLCTVCCICSRRDNKKWCPEEASQHVDPDPTSTPAVSITINIHSLTRQQTDMIKKQGWISVTTSSNYHSLHNVCLLAWAISSHHIPQPNWASRPWHWDDLAFMLHSLLCCVLCLHEVVCDRNIILVAFEVTYTSYLA